MTRQLGTWRALVVTSVLIGVALCAACDARKPAPGVSTSWDQVCVDLDGDGYGFQCGPGEDCDEGDPEVHEGCAMSCRKPVEGCPCEEGAEPADCRLPYTLSGGDLLCHVGTRYCRDGAWSACEGVVTFAVPPPLRGLESRSLISADAGSRFCAGEGECDPSCRRITDKLDTPFGPDAGVGTRVVSADAGGVTLTRQVSGGAGLPPVSVAPVDDVPCSTDDGPDCDGLPSPFDPDPTSAPSNTTHKTMFFDVAAGASQTQRFRTKALGVTALDVYLYADSTGEYDDSTGDTSMGRVLGALADDFTDGSFLPASITTCLAGPNDQRSQGIAGNIACLIPDVRFGVGWFRDIPFYGPIPGVDRHIAPWDMELFEHEHDLSADAASVAQQLVALDPRPNLNTPEGGMQGLWSIATGEELYLGWNRSGIPKRLGCPADTTFGYPCFRNKALPVVLMFTDAPMQNGPATAQRWVPFTPANCLADAFPYGGVSVCDPLNYPSEVLGMRAGSGTDPHYLSLTESAESFLDAEPVGSVDGKLVTYVGDTTAMSDDFGPDDAPDCVQWNTGEIARDVMFHFSVATQGTYLVSARGTRFDAMLILAKRGSDGRPAEIVGCDDDSATDLAALQTRELGVTPELSRVLAPGDYVAVLKGQTGLAHGRFQVSIGDPNVAQSRVFEAKRWAAEPGGVLQALRAKDIRVITIQSGDNAYTEEQALAVASATKAVGALGESLHGSVDRDGTVLGTSLRTGLGPEVVRVLRQLVDHTKLKVSLALDPALGANPGFRVRIEAVRQIGDGCTGADDVDNDGVLDTYDSCEKGATPEFRVTFENPAGAPVPPNQADPTGQGGYSMWFQVLGDGKLLLDRLHVYVVPSTVRGAVTISYPATGVYEQSLQVDYCRDDEGPLWGALAWQASLPPGTSIRMKMCGAESAEQLSECSARDALEVFTLTPGGTCTADADCGGLGYCDRGQVCHLIRGPSCMVDADCGAFGTCGGTAGNTHCTNTQATLALHPVAKEGFQRRRFARVYVELASDASRAQAPTLLNWNVTYNCVPLE